MSKQKYIEQLFNTMGQLRKLLEHPAHESHAQRATTVMQFSALKFLNNNHESTVGDVAVYLNLSKSSATQLIERLVKVNLVERTNDSDDRRIVRLIITPLGEQEIINLKKKFMDKMSKIFSKIPEEDLKELVRIQTDLINTLKKEQMR